MDENNKIFLKYAFAMAILSMYSLMPVESNYEITVLKILISTCRDFKNIKIEKPMFDTIIDNFRFRPDFIIHCQDIKKIYIEVLGSHNKEYINHKEVISSKARQYCNEYISIRAFNSNK